MDESRITELERIIEKDKKDKEKLVSNLKEVAERLDKIQKKRYICRTISVFIICLTILGLFTIGEIFYNKDFINAQEIHNEIYQSGVVNTLNINREGDDQ